MSQPIQPDPKNALIIVNPVSGKPGLANNMSDIKTLAKKFGWQGNITETTAHRGADVIIDAALKKGTTHFVVCGGDGTISQAVMALTQKPAMLGVVPGGTGNLFAQNLAIPVDPEQSLEIALTGKAFVMDVGVANGVYFTIMTGMGLDAQMVSQADRALKNKIGVLAYLSTLVKNLPRPAARYQISIDRQPAKVFKAKSVMVANLGRISGGLEVVPKTDPQNGTLQVGVIQASGFLSWVSMIGHGVLGRIDQSDHYTLLQGSHITVKCLGSQQPFECDGNDFGPVAELVVDLLPKSLWVLRP